MHFSENVFRLFHKSDGVAYKEARFGQGSGPIWLDDLKCGGSETTLGDCRSSGWNNSNCGHEEDAAVECSPGRVPGNIYRVMGTRKMALSCHFHFQALSRQVFSH